MMKAFMLCVLALAVGILTGCGVVESTKDKAVNLQLGVYGGRIIASDPVADGAPSGQLGFGTIDYHSTPVKAGQSFKAKRTIWSIWGGKSSETVIEVGGLKNYEVVTKEVPAGVIDFSTKGVLTNELVTNAESDTSQK